MPLGTIERKPPAFFKHGMSSLSKLVVFSILSVVLMVADVRYGVTQPLRATISLLLYPMEWLSMRPQWLFDVTGRFFEGRDDAQAQVQAMTLKLQQQALRSGQVEQLALENLQLRRLLELRERHADIEVGDLLTTSGVDAIYPPGVPVAVVVKVERRAESVFARILCQPQGRVQGARHVMVLEPLGKQVPARPPYERPSTLPIKGGPR